VSYAVSEPARSPTVHHVVNAGPDQVVLLSLLGVTYTLKASFRDPDTPTGPGHTRSPGVTGPRRRARPRVRATISASHPLREHPRDAQGHCDRTRCARRLGLGLEGAHIDPVSGRGAHHFTVDLEEYFQVSAFEGRVARSDWERLESRVAPQVALLLDLLARPEARATFFVLGWLAERQGRPGPDHRARGSRIASHGWDHGAA